MRLALVATLLLFLSSLPVASAADSGLNVGQAPPAFVLKDLSGRQVGPLERKGKIILLNFWSTLCAPCVAELSSLNRLHNALKDAPFEIISVAIDSAERPVRELVSKEKIGFIVLLDPEKEVFFDLYAGPVLPASYLIDRNGIIVEKFSGPREWDSGEMKDKIRKLLGRR